MKTLASDGVCVKDEQSEDPGFDRVSLNIEVQWYEKVLSEAIT